MPEVTCCDRLDVRFGENSLLSDLESVDHSGRVHIGPVRARINTCEFVPPYERNGVERRFQKHFDIFFS